MDPTTDRAGVSAISPSRGRRQGRSKVFNATVNGKEYRIIEIEISSDIDNWREGLLTIKFYLGGSIPTKEFESMGEIRIETPSLSDDIVFRMKGPKGRTRSVRYSDQRDAWVETFCFEGRRVVEGEGEDAD